MYGTETWNNSSEKFTINLSQVAFEIKRNTSGVESDKEVFLASIYL